MKNQKGFTLIELLVVIAIIGLLATLAVVSLGNARSRARDAKRQSDLKAIATAMELYNTENAAYPINGTCGNNGVIAGGMAGALNPICAPPDGLKDENQVYMQAYPQDPQNKDEDGTVYKHKGDANGYCLQVALEKGGYFLCQNGSCYESPNACP